VAILAAAATYAAQGLRINAVAPGMTETPMTQGMLKLPAMREGDAAIDWLLSPEAARSPVGCWRSMAASPPCDPW
jgi:NAD(P)-dependent dehydrogenase (short-subunit alcohol dehydrogenase family)